MRGGRRLQQSYGAGLARYLRARGIEVLEAERPEHRRRSSRRNLQKSDPSDAERAARTVLAVEASGVPKSGDGLVEMIRALRAARRSAIKARTQAANQLQALRVTAPEQLRQRLRGLSTKEFLSVAARFRLADGPSDVQAATKFALRSVPAVTRLSRQRSQSLTHNSIGWWRKPPRAPRGWSPCRVSAPTTPLPS